MLLTDMHATLYALHSAHTEAALTGHRHYAAALRVMLNRQIADLRPDLGQGAVLGLPEQQTRATSRETPAIRLHEPQSAAQAVQESYDAARVIASHAH